MNAHKRQVMLCETGDDRQAELRHIRDLAAAQVAGVVIVPTPKPLTAVARLLKTMPHVQLVRRAPSLGPQRQKPETPRRPSASERLTDLPA
jgi:DNA-binding LacI/PurR family transcriptional regulator